jgi:hypothetical protein
MVKFFTVDLDLAVLSKFGYFGWGCITTTGLIILDTVCHPLNFMKPNVSKTESVSIIRCKGGKVPIDLCPLKRHNPHRWSLHLIVVVGFECSRDPESYAGGSVATGRFTHAGQIKG